MHCWRSFLSLYVSLELILRPTLPALVSKTIKFMLKTRSENTSSSKSFAKRIRLILHLPTATPSSIRLWLSIQLVETVERSGDSTHPFRSPTPTLHGCDWSQLTRSRTSQPEYNDVTASIRLPSAWHSRNTPTNVSRGVRPYAFSMSKNKTFFIFNFFSYSIVAYSQDFCKNCLRVKNLVR